MEELPQDLITRLFYVYRNVYVYLIYNLKTKMIGEVTLHNYFEGNYAYPP